MDNNNYQENAMKDDNVKDQSVDKNREAILKEIRQEAKEIQELTKQMKEQMKHNDDYCYLYLDKEMKQSDNNKS